MRQTLTLSVLTIALTWLSGNSEAYQVDPNNFAPPVPLSHPAVQELCRDRVHALLLDGIDICPQSLWNRVREKTDPGLLIWTLLAMGGIAWWLRQPLNTGVISDDPWTPSEDAPKPPVVAGQEEETTDAQEPPSIQALFSQYCGGQIMDITTLQHLHRWLYAVFQGFMREFQTDMLQVIEREAALWIIHRLCIFYRLDCNLEVCGEPMGAEHFSQDLVVIFGVENANLSLLEGHLNALWDHNNGGYSANIQAIQNILFPTSQD